MNSAAWTEGPALQDQAFSKEDPFKMSVLHVINEFAIKPTAAPIVPAVAASMPRIVGNDRQSASLPTPICDLFRRLPDHVGACAPSLTFAISPRYGIRNSRPFASWCYG